MTAWQGGANGYTDQDGEWARSSGYTYILNLFRSVETERDWLSFYESDNRVRVDAKLSIWSSWKPKGRYHWSLSTTVNGRAFGLNVASGITTSVESCKRQALTALANVDAVDTAIRDFYGRKRVSTVSTVDGIELMSVFDFAIGSCSFLPAGEYRVREANHVSRLTKKWGCTSITGIEAAA